MKFQSRKMIDLIPRGLSREQAAGIGASKFDQLVSDGRMPKPKRIDGRVVWDRCELDGAFECLPEGGSPNPWDQVLGTPR